MRAIDRAKDHFNSLHVKRIEVPEWGDDKGPFVVYTKPFTLRDQGKLQVASKNSNESEMLADLLIMKALDEKGDPLFTIEDKVALRTNVDANVLARIAAQIMLAVPQELEKNS
jgi:hypothetical protein